MGNGLVKAGAFTGEVDFPSESDEEFVNEIRGETAFHVTIFVVTPCLYLGHFIFFFLSPRLSFF